MHVVARYAYVTVNYVKVVTMSPPNFDRRVWLCYHYPSMWPTSLSSLKEHRRHERYIGDFKQHCSKPAAWDIIYIGAPTATTLRASYTVDGKEECSYA